MTSIIPFSGLIIDILSFVALVKTFGTWLTTAIVASFFIAASATNRLKTEHQKNGIHGDKSVFFKAALWQDVQCAIALYGLFWFK